MAADMTGVPITSTKKKLPELPAKAAQIVQDFGTGPMLLWPLLAEASQTELRQRALPVFLGGAVLFGLGWMIRQPTSHKN
jgi:hypothetical protein